MARRRWTTSSSVGILAAAGGAATAGELLAPDYDSAAVVGAAGSALVVAGVLAARAIAASARDARNPPRRNELPDSPVEPDLILAAHDKGRRNPMGSALAEHGAVVPQPYATCDVDSTDGSFDCMLAMGRAVRAVRATDVIAASPPGEPAARPTEALTQDALEGAVWLMPGARYHIHELGPLAQELSRSGVPWAFALVAAPGAGMANELSKWTAEYHVVHDTQALIETRPRALALMSDWGAHRDFVRKAKATGVPTFAKVEGAQDFGNRDTIRRTLPYRVADYVMCQGPYDLEKVGSRGIAVGSCRLEGILALRDLDLIEPTRVGYVVANYNFSYGTRDYAAEKWLQSVQSACAAADRDLAASVHPAVAPPRDVPVCAFPLAFELERASAFITRCSTALLDAAAMGTRVAYFNPHRERSWSDLPLGLAVPRIKSTGHLSSWLRDAGAEMGADARSWLTTEFLSVGPEPSERRMASLVIRAS